MWRAVRELEPTDPASVSVTYGAGGSSRDRTVRITGGIAQETTLLPVGHLTAVNHSVAELRHVIGSYAAAGVCNMLALRGDPPGGVGAPPAGPLARRGAGAAPPRPRRLLRRGGGPPEGHPRSPDLDSDVAYLVAKLRAGARFAATQMFFRVEDYLRLRDRVAAAGPDVAEVPILAGIMPITSVKGIQAGS